MFDLLEHVMIKHNKVPGIIVDKRATGEAAWYTVESDLTDRELARRGVEFDGLGGTWPLFDCTDADMERISEKVAPHSVALPKATHENAA